MPKLPSPTDQFLAYAAQQNLTVRSRFQFHRITIKYDPTTTDRTEIAFTDNPAIAKTDKTTPKLNENTPIYIYDYAIEVRQYCTDPEILIDKNNTTKQYVTTHTYFFKKSTSIKKAMERVTK